MPVSKRKAKPGLPLGSGHEIDPPLRRIYTMKPSIAYLINSAKRTITEVTHNGLKDMQQLVGGHIEGAWMSPADDVLYVDEEGLLKPQEHFFICLGRPDRQPLAGNGLFVGREILDRDGEWIGTADPSISIKAFTPFVQFVSRAYVDAWGKANASEPSQQFAYIEETDEGNRLVVETMRTWGQVISGLPRKG
jgi:hypothetical protein